MIQKTYQIDTRYNIEVLDNEWTKVFKDNTMLANVINEEESYQVIYQDRIKDTETEEITAEDFA